MRTTFRKGFFFIDSRFFYVLANFQEKMSNCASCKVQVQVAFVGKYCVRFGASIKQFCSNKCLEDHKKGLKVMSPLDVEKYDFTQKFLNFPLFFVGLLLLPKGHLQWRWFPGPNWEQRPIQRLLCPNLFAKVRSSSKWQTN